MKVRGFTVNHTRKPQSVCGLAHNCLICDKNKLTDEGCKGAPDWIIEIVSPSSRPMDYNKKLFKYRTAGVREYWIVDYGRNLITVYNFEHDEMTDHTFSDKVRAGIYEDLEIDFSGIAIE